jgi:hypothetical protein
VAIRRSGLAKVARGGRGEETDSPEQYTEFIRDVAPQLTTLLGDQPTVVQRVWEKVTDAYRQFQGDDGRVLTENQAIWFKGIK